MLDLQAIYDKVRKIQAILKECITNKGEIILTNTSLNMLTSLIQDCLDSIIELVAEEKVPLEEQARVSVLMQRLMAIMNDIKDSLPDSVAAKEQEEPAVN